MKLHELAKRLDLSVEGDGDTEIHKLSSLHTATAGDLTFVVSTQYRNALRATEAAAVLVPPMLIDDAPCPCIVCDSPYHAYAAASWILHPEAEPIAGISNTASVHPSAKVHESASIGDFVVIGADCEIGPRAVIGSQVSLESGVRIGDGSRLMARVSVAKDCTIGADCRIQSGAVIGSEGFGFAPSREGWQAIHQIGSVVIGAMA